MEYNVNKYLIIITLLVVLAVPVNAEDLIDVSQQTVDRTYSFSADNNSYTAEKNFGATGAGSFTIQGYIDENGNKSVIDLNHHIGQRISKATTLKIIDTTIKNGYYTEGTSYGTALRIANANASVILENVDFINNYFGRTDGDPKGAAVNITNGVVEKITGKFEGNVIEQYMVANKNAAGAAIGNSSKGLIKEIDAIFINNKSIAVDNSGNTVGASAGAIYNKSTINNLKGKFLGNEAINNENGGSWGGAIHNDGTIDNIEAYFEGNRAQGGSHAIGGAIYNYKTIKNLNGKFVNNASVANNDSAVAGAVYNRSNCTIENINSNFIGNYAQSSNSYATGGALYNQGTIYNIIGNFDSNYVKSSGTYARGGAVYNSGNIGLIQGEFVNNIVQTSGTYAIAGAISNSLDIDIIRGSFINNQVQSTGTYAGGGAIYNNGNINIIDADFLNNHAESSTSEYLAFGGAVYTNKDLNFVSDNKIHTFSGNYTKDYRGKINNAIFVKTAEDSHPTITFNALNNGKFIINDTIDGGDLYEGVQKVKREEQYNLALKGDSTGKVYLNNSVYNANISHNDVTTYTNGMEYLNQPDALNSLTMNSGTLNIGSLTTAPLHFQTFGMNGGTINRQCSSRFGQ